MNNIYFDKFSGLYVQRLDGQAAFDYIQDQFNNLQDMRDEGCDQFVLDLVYTDIQDNLYQARHSGYITVAVPISTALESMVGGE